MVHIPTYEDFLQHHEQQLRSSGVPQHFYETLHKKLTTQTFDAGNVFSLLQIDYEDEERGPCEPVWQLQVFSEDSADTDGLSTPNVSATLSASDGQHIYLIDHAWTFRVENAKKQLLEIDPLRQRMAFVMGLDFTEEKHSLSDKIFEELWRCCNTYSLGNAENIEDRMPVWYIMDEVGSAINHSDDPNVRMVPFVYVPEQMTYSLIFPIKDVRTGDVITRDFVESIDKNLEKVREAALLPWQPKSFLEESFEHFEPDADYFLNGHISETLPILARFEQPMPKKDCYKVFTEYSVMVNHITDKRFEITQDVNEADIMWFTKHFKKFEELSETPHKFVNQFPFEYVVTVKDLLCITCRRINKITNAEGNKDNKEVSDVTFPEWLPTTYNLVTEITQFVSYFQHREKQGLDNHWIMKPFNLARGLDTHITSNINYIMRLPITGPKIVQKYIDRPVLFHRPECDGKVKFDIRYVVLLKSVKPLKVYAYRNFFLRFANKPFELNNFDVYEQHFTVMNYTEGVQLKKIVCAEFKELWSEQYPDNHWKEVEDGIFKMLREVFEAATMEAPPCGISESPQSRALFAADIMLEWTGDGRIQNKLLEINWTPDCKRACDYYPEFYNDIFRLLFLGEENDEVFESL